MKKIIFFIDKLNNWILNILAILFGIVSILTLWQIFARYILENPLSWSEALVRYVIIWIILLGTAVALRKGMLISVEIVHFLVPKVIKKLLTIIVLVINIAFFLFMIIYGFDIVGNLSGQTSGSLGISVSWFYAALPIGGIIALMNAVAILLELFIGEEKEGNNDGTVIN